MRSTWTIAAAAVLTACGSSTTTTESVDEILPAVQPAGPSETTPTTDSTGPSTTVATSIAPFDDLPTSTEPARTTPLDGDSCRIAERTAATAVEAFYAQFRVDATSMEELVDAELLREPILHFQLHPDPETGIPAVLPTPDGPCDYAYDEAADVLAAESTDAVRSGTCGVERLLLQIAVRRITFVDGTAPTDVDRVTELLPGADWFFDVGLAGDGTVLVTTSPCDPRDLVRDADPRWADISTECATDLVLVTGAVSLAEREGLPISPIDVLVENHHLEDRSYRYDVDPLGILIDRAESGCPGVEEQPEPTVDEPTQACSVERRVVETAIEAYIAEHGAAPTSLDDLVTAGLLAAEPLHHVLDFDGPLQVVAEPSGPCATD